MIEWEGTNIYRRSDSRKIITQAVKAKELMYSLVMGFVSRSVYVDAQQKPRVGWSVQFPQTLHIEKKIILVLVL